MTMQEREGNVRRRMRKILLVFMSLVLGITAVIFGISSYAAYDMTTTANRPVSQTPAQFGLRYTDITFRSTDNLTLRGWWLAGSRADSAVIMVHGADMNRADPSIGMLDIAAELVKHGYNVLMFDLRGHGESDRTHISAGYFEKRDVLGAIDYTRNRGTTRIGILGYSMGAASSLMAAAESESIQAIVADSSFADMEDLINSQFSIRSSLPGFFIPLILMMDRIMYGIDFKQVKPVESVKDIYCPIFVIAGGQDDTVTTDQARQLFESSSNTLSQLWILPEARHVGSYLARPEEYIEKIEAFFDAAMP